MSEDTSTQPEPQTEDDSQSGGWGSWFSSVAAKAADIYSSNIAPTLEPALSSVSETTGKIVSDLAEIIDVDDEDDVSPVVSRAPKAQDHDNKSEISNGPHEQAVPTDSEIKEAKTEQDPPKDESDDDDDDDFTKVIGQGVSAVQAGAQSLYGMFTRGVETVQHANVADLAIQGIEKSKQVLQAGVKASQDVADKSLEALEKVGEKAMEVLTSADEKAAQEASKSQPNESNRNPPRRPGPGVITGDTPRKKSKELTYETAFEEKLGTASLQSLENLSIECMMKTQQLYRKFDADKRENVDEQFSALQEIFNIPRAEGVKPQLPSTKISDRVDSKQQAFSKAIERSKDKLKALQSQLQTSIDEFKAAHEAAAEKDPNEASDLAGLILSNELKIRQESIMQLAELSALAVDIVMRVAEAFHDSEAPEVVKNMSVTDKATFLNDLADFFSEEISGLSAAHVDSIRQVVAHLKAIPNISKATIQSSEKEMSSLYMDSGSAISHISEAKKFTVQLCKFLLIQAESLSIASEPVPPQSP